MPAWVAALITIGFLSAFTRDIPWCRVPVGTIVLASALAIVAVGVFNNLPATLVTLPHITRTATVWPLLFGLNAGRPS